MADYEQVTKDIREGFSQITANKEDKSEETVMKEILAVLTIACEQNDIDKYGFMRQWLPGHFRVISRGWR